MSTAKTRMDFSRFPRKDLPKDEILFFEEEESREMYLLLTGALGIYRQEIQVATIDEPLSVVGELSVLTQKPRQATVRALEPSVLMVVDDPDRLFSEYPQLGSKLARTLARRLVAMNDKFLQLKSAVARTVIERPPRDAEAIAEVESTLPSVPVVRTPAPAAARDDIDQPTLPMPPPPTASAPDLLDRALFASDIPASALAGLEPELGEDVIDALSAILDWDPALGAGT